MKHLREEFVDDAQHRSSEIGGDFSWTVASDQHCLEEPGRSRYVAPPRHQHVDDLAASVDGSVHVQPDAGDLDVGFVDEPAIADTVTARPGSVDDQQRESLHLPLESDVIDFDAAFGPELLDIAAGQAMAEIPAHSHQDHVGREPESSE